MIKGVYSATCSILHDDCSLNVDATIAHAASSIKSGLHGVIFFGSTGQGQLIDLNSKKNLISKAANHKLRKQFFFGTGCNSLNDTINLIKYGMEYEFKTWLIMPPAYYSSNTEQGVYNFYKNIIRQIPKVKIILYNFEKLSGYKFSIECINDLVKKFPDQIVGVKDSTYNLYEKLNLENFSVFPGSELKLLKGLELGCSGIITATCNVTAEISRKVYDDFHSGKEQSLNQKLCDVRSAFDKYNLISGLHTFYAQDKEIYKNILPPLSLLDKIEEKDLINTLKDLNFTNKSSLAA